MTAPADAGTLDSPAATIAAIRAELADFDPARAAELRARIGADYTTITAGAGHRERMQLAQWGRLLEARVDRERPWTLYVNCAGTAAYWVAGGDTDAAGTFARYLGSAPDRTCTHCGDSAWWDATDGAPTPDTHNGPWAAAPRITAPAPSRIERAARRLAGRLAS